MFKFSKYARRNALSAAAPPLERKVICMLRLVQMSLVDKKVWKVKRYSILPNPKSRVRSYYNRNDVYNKFLEHANN